MCSLKIDCCLNQKTNQKSKFFSNYYGFIENNFVIYMRGMLTNDPLEVSYTLDNHS